MQECPAWEESSGFCMVPGRVRMPGCLEAAGEQGDLSMATQTPPDPHPGHPDPSQAHTPQPLLVGSGSQVRRSVWFKSTCRRLVPQRHWGNIGSPGNPCKFPQRETLSTHTQTVLSRGGGVYSWVRKHTVITLGGFGGDTKCYFSVPSREEDIAWHVPLPVLICRN